MHSSWRVANAPKCPTMNHACCVRADSAARYTNLYAHVDADAQADSDEAAHIVANIHANDSFYKQFHFHVSSNNVVGTHFHQQLLRQRRPHRCLLASSSTAIATSSPTLLPTSSPTIVVTSPPARWRRPPRRPRFQHRRQHWCRSPRRPLIPRTSPTLSPTPLPTSSPTGSAIPQDVVRPCRQLPVQRWHGYFEGKPWSLQIMMFLDTPSVMRFDVVR